MNFEKIGPHSRNLKKNMYSHYLIKSVHPEVLSVAWMKL